MLLAELTDRFDEALDLADDTIKDNALIREHRLARALLNLAAYADRLVAVIELGQEWLAAEEAWLVINNLVNERNCTGKREAFRDSCRALEEPCKK